MGGGQEFETGLESRERCCQTLHTCHGSTPRPFWHPPTASFTKPSWHDTPAQSRRLQMQGGGDDGSAQMLFQVCCFFVLFFSATSLSICFLSFDATGICWCSQQAIAVFCAAGKRAVGAGRISRVCLGCGDSCWERPEIKEKWCQALDFQDRDVCFYDWDFIQVGYRINGLTPTLASWEQLVRRMKLMLPSGY